MKNLFQQSRFLSLKFAISLAVLFFAAVIGAAFCLPWHQKYNASVALITSEGDESVLENIILDGIISKNGYQTTFSVTGDWAAMQTETFAPVSQTSWQNWSNQLSAFRYDLVYDGYGINEMNRNYFLAEGATSSLLSREEVQVQGAEVWQEEEIIVYDNHLSVDWVVPSFCFIEVSNVFAYGYTSSSTNGIVADYAIPAQQQGWQMEYIQREYEYQDGQIEQEDPAWESCTIPQDYTVTNFMQLSATIDGVDYITLPTLVGAVGDNGIYQLTATTNSSYAWYGPYGPIMDLGDPAVYTDYMAQREAVYIYDIQTEGAPDRITCGMIAHKDTLFLLTAQLEDVQQEAGADVMQSTTNVTQQANQEQGEMQATALTLTAIDPIKGTVLDTVLLGSYPLQEDCPPMLYQNENYLSVGIAIATGANEYYPEYGGFTALSFAFDATSGTVASTAQAQTSQAAQGNLISTASAQNERYSETGALQLCDTTTFIRSAFGDATCLQDVYFDGDTLFLMETSMYNMGDAFDQNSVYNATFLGRYLTHRLMAFQGGDCVWQGYLSTDIYQDYLRDYYDSWSSERVVSNLKFHQEGEVRP